MDQRWSHFNWVPDVFFSQKDSTSQGSQKSTASAAFNILADSHDLPLEFINNSSGSVAFFGAFLFLMHLTFKSNCSVALAFASSSPLENKLNKI